MQTKKITKKTAPKKVVKKFTKFKSNILSRHPTHGILRQQGVLELLPFRSVIRLGSTTTVQQFNNNRRVKLNADQLERVIECNSVEAIQNSANKYKMKNCFHLGKVKTADWYLADNYGGDIMFKLPNPAGVGNEMIQNKDLPYPIVAKNIFGSRGTGNTLLNTQAELEAWLKGKQLNRYIFEKYYNYNKEYRLHMSADGCFYTCRKMLKEEHKDDKNNWQRHDNNCVWILENNANFDKPSNWNTIVEECKKALVSTGLDVGAVDLRVQNELNNKGKKRDVIDFIIVEINSAPSFGDVTSQKYIQELPKILKAKFVNK